MKLTRTGLVSPKINCYSIVASGWYGDMDERFHWDRTYTTREAVDCVLADAVMLTKLCMYNHPPYAFLETHKEIEAWLKERELTPSKIPTDCCSHEMLPHVDNLLISHHDGIGSQYGLAVENFPHNPPKTEREKFLETVKKDVNNGLIDMWFDRVESGKPCSTEEVFREINEMWASKNTHSEESEQL